MITLISTPAYYDPVDSSVICRWLATESPNNFRLFRNDWSVTSEVNAGGYLRIVIDEPGVFPGNITDDIAVYNYFNNSMYVGKITNIAGTTITTDIDWVTYMDIRYMNDNTVYGNYYFEGRLTINGIIEPLTIIASPDSFGYADLDVSGVLRIKTSLGKTGNYSTWIMKEPTKSGHFSFEYRGCWYGSSEDWTPEGGSASPPIDPEILWYYGECVRSEEQGSNLHNYVPDILNDAPFLNQFTEPVYFYGLPFDLSFILPETAIISPASDMTVEINAYNSLNTLLKTTTIIFDVDDLEGFINSLNIDTTLMTEDTAFITAEILV